MTTLLDTSIKLSSFIPRNLYARCLLHASLLHAVDPPKFGNRLAHWPASKLSSARRMLDSFDAQSVLDR